MRRADVRLAHDLHVGVDLGSREEREQFSSTGEPQDGDAVQGVVCELVARPPKVPSFDDGEVHGSTVAAVWGIGGDLVNYDHAQVADKDLVSSRLSVAVEEFFVLLFFCLIFGK